MTIQMLALGAASSPIQPVPALDIEEFLDRRAWQERDLTAGEKLLLARAKDFLEKVLAGQRIIRDAATENGFTLDVLSLDAYEYTRRALETSIASPCQSFTEAEEAVNKAFRDILEIAEKEGEPSSANASAASRFFETIAHYSYSRGLAVPTR